MKLHRKAQISLEFIVIVIFILIFAFYFTSMIYNTSQINKSVSIVKNKTLELLSRKNSTSYIESVQYFVSTQDLNFEIYIKKLDGVSLDLNDYNVSLENIKKSTNYSNANVDIHYH